MNDELEKAQKSLEIFKELHYKNSKEHKKWNIMYHELIPIGGYDERYNKSFEEVKEVLEKIPKEEKGETFITYLNNSFIFFFGEEPGLEDLSWEKYVKILRDSSNYLKYFKNLKGGCIEIKSDYRVVFDPDKLNIFCSNIIAEIA